MSIFARNPLGASTWVKKDIHRNQVVAEGRSAANAGQSIIVATAWDLYQRFLKVWASQFHGGEGNLK